MFTVKSTYKHVILYEPRPRGSTNSVNSIWKKMRHDNKLPPRVNIFTWKILFNTLHLRLTLISMNIVVYFYLTILIYRMHMHPGNLYLLLKFKLNLPQPLTFLGTSPSQMYLPLLRLLSFNKFICISYKKNMTMQKLTMIDMIQKNP